MSKRTRRKPGLSRGGFGRRNLQDLERGHILHTFGAPDWERLSSDRWQATGGERLVGEVHGMVGDGKEATVYWCAGTDVLGIADCIAKVYRAQTYRAFNNAGSYFDAQSLRDRRGRKAVRQGTKRGREIAHANWVEREWETMTCLADNDASVPQPYARSSDAILMEFLGSTEPAPLLLRARFVDETQARAAFEEIMANVALFLALDIVHGDLSAYNVLWVADRPVIIDFPQHVDPRSHPDGQNLLFRDVANIVQFFARHSAAAQLKCRCR